MSRHLPSVWHRPFLAESGLSRLMDEVFGDFSDVGFDISPSVGKTDVYEKDGNVIYEMELPGVTKRRSRDQRRSGSSHNLWGDQAQ